MRQRAINNTVILMAAALLLSYSSQSLLAQGIQQSHLYFFTSDGCAPCRQVEPAIEALHRDGYPVSTVNVRQQPQLANRFQVDRTPTVILVTGNRMTGRHAGQIDLPTLKDWFAAVGQKPDAGKQTATSSPTAEFSSNDQYTPSAKGTKVVIDEAGTRTSDGFTSPTMLKGTPTPSNMAERRAIAATVRLKVEDPEGISYATGTIVHARPGEALVLTCGHVFRDAHGKGVITAEYGFDSPNIESVPGQLIHYDAKAHDIGLVAIQTRGTLVPVEVAHANTTVERGDRSFSIGCDHGQNPTIRHTAIKNRATYDGEIKYDIFGRPVDGRSGGGLFNDRGELIGVCNAAAVEVDEGIYSGLATIHWQFAETNLANLFGPDSSLDSKVAASSDRFASLDDHRRSPDQHFASSLASQRDTPARTRIAPRQQLVGGSLERRPQTSAANYQLDRSAVDHRLLDGGRSSRSSDSDMEVIILVRSKTDPRITDTITVSDPSNQLLDYLREMNHSSEPARRLDIARLRMQSGEFSDSEQTTSWR